MALGEDQKIFIKKKVKELGSMEAVESLYNKECAVADFAHAYARKVYNVKIKRTPTK